MERNPYSSSEDAENKTSNKDKKSDGFRVAPFHIPGLAENKYQPRPEKRQEAPRASVALEGIISWREQDEMKHSIIKHDEGTREKKDEDQEKDDEEHETKPVSKEYPQPRPRTARPIGEILAEQHAIQKAKEAAAEAKEDSESDEDEEQEIQQAVQARLPRPDFEQPKPVAAEHSETTEAPDENQEESLRPFAPTQPLNFPQVTQRTEYQQPTVPKHEAVDESYVEDEDQPIPAAAVHQTLPMQGPGVAEQQPLPEDDDESTPVQPQYAQAYPAAPQVNGVVGQNPNYQPPINPNNQNAPINPAGWNQVPNPNAPTVVNGMAAMGNGNVPPAGPNIPGGNMGGNGNQPPVQPGYFGQPPFNPNNPAFGYNQAQNNYNNSPVMPIEHPHEVNARDPRVGVVAAALGLEYFARKRADRKLEKRINKSADERDRKQQKEAASDAIRERERQRRFDTEQQRQADELYRMRQAQQEYGTGAASTAPGDGYASGLPRPFEATNPVAGNQYAPAGQYGQAYNQAPAQPPPAAVQQPGMNPGVRQEMGVAPMVMGQRQEQRPQPQEAEIVDTQNQEPQQGRVEQSSWHNIVVDEHGREIAGAMQYGEGFRRERQQEVRNDPMSDTPSNSGHHLNGSSGSAGSANLFAGGTVSQQGVPTNIVYDQYGRPVQTHNLPSGMTNPGLPPGHPTHVDPQHQLEPSFKQPSNIANPWFWIMLLLIIAAFFTAAFV